jgi:hypothetical protein
MPVKVHCGFNYRFNSRISKRHPFVVAKLSTLADAQAKAIELPIQSRLHRKRARRLRAAQDFMVRTVNHSTRSRVWNGGGAAAMGSSPCGSRFATFGERLIGPKGSIKIRELE